MEILSINVSDVEYAFFMQLKDALGAKCSKRRALFAACVALSRDKKLSASTRAQLKKMEEMVRADEQREITRHELRRLTMLVNQEKIIKRLSEQGFDGVKIKKVKRLFNDELRASGLTRTRHEKAKALKIKRGKK